MGSSTIYITGISAQGRHGANPGERAVMQDFVIDLSVDVDVERDDLDATIDYRSLADLARDTVAQNSFQLLETLAEAVARAIYDVSAVALVTATVHKPAAARELGVEDVSAECTFSN